MARLGKSNFVEGGCLIKFVSYRVKTVDKWFDLCYNILKNMWRIRNEIYTKYDYMDG